MKIRTILLKTEIQRMPVSFTFYTCSINVSSRIFGLICHMLSQRHGRVSRTWSRSYNRGKIILLFCETVSLVVTGKYH
jgi:hypothetical protein